MFVVVIVFNVPPTAKVIWRQGQVWYLIVKIPGHEVIQLFACSTQLSMAFILLINVQMPTNAGILTFISRTNTAFESFKARTICI